MNREFTEGTEMMMRNAIVVVGTLSLLACSKDRPTGEPGSTTITGATSEVVSVDEIRRTLSERKGPAAMTGVTVLNEGGIVTLRGTVDDEMTRRDMLSAVRAMPNVKSVRDELVIKTKPEELAPPGETKTEPMAPSKGKEAPAEPGTLHTKNVDAVRARLTQEKAAPSAVLSGLTITDDGNMIHVSGTVPDQATRDAVIKSAKKTPGVKAVRDDLTIKGKAMEGKDIEGKDIEGKDIEGK